MKWLKRLWRRVFPVRTRQPEGYGETGTAVDISDKRVTLIVGHTATAMGAQTIDGKMSEYNYNLLVAKSMSERQGIGFARRDFGGMAGAARSIAKIKPDVNIELHCNAYNGKAHGAECLYIEGDEESRAYAEDMLESYCTRFSKRNRGAKALGKRGRGRKNLDYVKREGVRIALLFEPFFIDNEEDYISYQDYRDWLGEYLDGKK